MITVQQIRAARALLDWSQKGLGDKAGFSQTAVANIESGRHRAAESTIQAFKEAFDRNGIEFIDGGVRFRPDSLEVLRGEGFNTRIMDIVYETLIRTGSKEVLINGVDYGLVDDELRAAITAHVKRLQAAGLSERVLVQQDTKIANIVGPPAWHRRLPDVLFSGMAASFIFADCYAVMMIEKQEVIIVRNRSLAECHAKVFNFLWEQAKPL